MSARVRMHLYMSVFFSARVHKVCVHAAVAQHILGALDRAASRPRNFHSPSPMNDGHTHTRTHTSRTRHLHSQKQVPSTVRRSVSGSPHSTLKRILAQAVLGSLSKFIPMRGIRAEETRQQMIDTQIRIDGLLFCSLGGLDM